MKRRLMALLLALCFVAAAGVVPASALDEEDDAVRLVRTLNIMTGDENGNLNLSDAVKRSEFAKLLVMASAQKNKAGGAGDQSSPYQDVADEHWALSFIRLVTQQGWMTGYGDGTFHPDSTITIEEACASVLRLLGYNTQKLGEYPTAQLEKAETLALRDGLSLGRGDVMSRGDCARLFSSLMLTENAKGKVYAATIGYTVTNGELNLTAAMISNLSGPFVADYDSEFPFKPEELLVDGVSSDGYTLKANDVYYYHKGLRGAWVFTKRVTGRVEAVTTSSAGLPTSVTVFKKKYAIATPDAAYQLSELSGVAVNSYVTLLLGMNDGVAGVLKDSDVKGVYYGMVKSYSRASNQTKAAVETTYNVFCTDGTTRAFTVPGSTGVSFGSIVSVTVTQEGATLSRMPARTLTGKVNAGATAVDSTALAGNVRVIETDSNGYAAAAVDVKRLAGIQLSGSDVRGYTSDAEGRVDNLILNNVTGDAATYGYLFDKKGSNDTDDGKKDYYVTYSCVVNGKAASYGSAKRITVERGGVSVEFEKDGALKGITNLKSTTLSELSGSYAQGGGKTFSLWENVQVYLKNGDNYYTTPLASVNAAEYSLTGWYDSSKAGGLIRVIIAEPRQ